MYCTSKEVLAFDMYVGMPHCTVAASMGVTVQTKRSTRMWIPGAEMTSYGAIMYAVQSCMQCNHVRVGICVYSVPCPYM